MGCTDGLGLDKIGVNVESNSILINKFAKRSERIYAIGDVTTTPCLAHKASYQGNIAAEAISGKDLTNFERGKYTGVYVFKSSNSLNWAD